MGVSTFHMPWQGTVTLQPETFIRVVVDLCLSLQQQGLRRIVLLNGHGGNTALLQTAALQLREHGLLVAANASYWSLIPDEIARLCEPDGGALGHASHAETSLQLYLQPQHVDRATMTAQQKGTMSPWGIPQDLMRGMYMVPEFATYAPSGVGGDHTQATVEVGQRIVDAAARTLAQFIEAYRHLPMEAE
jgi:creatinine amidohydrolase